MTERAGKPQDSQPLLEVDDLRTYFYTRAGVVQAVQAVSFNLKQGETLGIVGESGSGKSVTAMSIMRLIPHPPGRFDSGHVRFRGQPIIDINTVTDKDGGVRRTDKSMSDAKMRHIRGGDIAMIFQDPMTSLNPLLTIGRQIAETVQEHMGCGKKEAYDRACAMLEKVGIPSPRARLKDFPFQFSGGMRQRVMIAMALSTNPDLLIADEPTTALDVTIQAQILDLVRGLSSEFGSSVILITHDMGVVAGMADRVAVMYAGYVVETGDLNEIFYQARHPYTHMLLRSIPRLDTEQGAPLAVIPGSPPRHAPPAAGLSLCPALPQRARYLPEGHAPP